MADIKCVVNDPKTGKSYSKALADSTAVAGRKLGEKLSGSLIELPGYELQIVGGSDIAGFPLRRDLEGTRRKKLLLVRGDIGLRQGRKGDVYRKTVSGNTINDTTAQLNLKITTYGSKSVEDLWGIKQEGKPAASQKTAA